MRMKYSIPFFVFALTGCVGTDVGNPQDSPENELRFVAEPVETETQMQALSQGGVQITDAWVVVDAIDLREDCSRVGARISEGPFAVDLLDTLAPGVPLDAEGSDSFCQMRIDFKASKDLGPEELHGRWLWIRGERADGVPFEITASKDETLAFVGRSARLDFGQRQNHFVAGFPFIKWIADGGLDTEPGDALVVDESQTPSTYQHFKQGFRDTARLYKDDDGDKELTAEELIPVGVPV